MAQDLHSTADILCDTSDRLAHTAQQVAGQTGVHVSLEEIITQALQELATKQTELRDALERISRMNVETIESVGSAGGHFARTAAHLQRAQESLVVAVEGLQPATRDIPGA